MVHLLPIYAAREENTSGVSSRELAVKTLEYTTAVQHHDSVETLTAELRATLDETMVLVVMGAGTVSAVAEQLTT